MDQGSGFLLFVLFSTSIILDTQYRLGKALPVWLCLTFFFWRLLQFTISPAGIFYTFLYHQMTCLPQISSPNQKDYTLLQQANY